MSQFVSLNYYFDTTPGVQFKYWLVMLIFAGILAVISILIRAYRQKTNDKILKKMVKSYPGKFMWFAVIAAFLVWIRLENIVLLSMRFWWVIYFGLFFYSIINSIKVFYREYPRKLKQSLSHRDQNKYVPVPKNKKKK